MAHSLRPSIHFYFHHVFYSLRNRKPLKEFISRMFRKEQKKLGQLNYVFCSDQTLLQMNREYLNHDFYTDIISFDLSGSTDKISGEIYISLDRVKENAQLFKAPLVEELHRVIFHGALHLCGYGDKSEAEQRTMRKKEDFYLKSYFERFT